MRIFVEGLGRCGSTMVYLALAAAAPAHYRRGFHRHFSEAPPEAGIYKTHDYPPKTFADGDRVVYLFGDPERIVRSVLFTDRRFKEDHFRNFGREYRNDEESLLLRDGLGLREHFHAWKNTSSGIPTIFLHYESIWDEIEALRTFTGLVVNLPDRKPTRELPAILLKTNFSELRGEMDELVFLRPAAANSIIRR